MDERTRKLCIRCGKQLPCNLISMDCTGIHCKNCYAFKGNSYELCKCNHYDLLIVAQDKIAYLESEIARIHPEYSTILKTLKQANKELQNINDELNKSMGYF